MHIIVVNANHKGVLNIMAYQSNMTSLIKISTLFLLAFFFSCSAPEKSNSHSGQVTHIVLCWLKQPGNAGYRQQIVQSSLSMQKIPGVIEVRTGTPVKSDRPVVDDSFDVGITFLFKDQVAMNAYLEHPLHKELQQRVMKSLVKKVVIYDILENAKAGAGD